MAQSPQELNLNLSKEKERIVSSNQKQRLSIKYALIAVMAALTAVSTGFLWIPIPATQGYFNVGDIFVYITAILFGPFIGAIAGGFGSALGDILAQYPYYAPITLVAKGMEGLIVGWLYKVLRKTQKDVKIKIFASFISLIAGLLISIIGNSIGWILIGSIFAFSVISISFFTKSETSVKIFSIFCGGTFMVLTYLISQYYILEFGANAFIEIPANITQVIIGMLVAIPLTEMIKKTNVIKNLD